MRTRGSISNREPEGQPTRVIARSGWSPGGLLAVLTLVAFLAGSPSAGPRQGRRPEAVLVSGVGHALSVVLEGLLLASIAIPAYVLLKNRLHRSMLAAGTTADELRPQPGRERSVGPDAYRVQFR